MPLDPFDEGRPAGADHLVHDDRAGDVLDQLALHRPDELAALLEVGLARLRADQLVDLLVAIAGIVALRRAGIILDQIDVGIVDGDAGAVETDGLVLALYLRVPDAGVDRVELGPLGWIKSFA